MKGKLIIKKNKNGGVAYRVEYTSAKGVPMSAAVSGTAKRFQDSDATDGMEVEIELKNGQPSKVTIDGKPIIAGQAVVREQARGPHNPQGGGGGAGRAAPRRPANTDATAPYNFISAERPIGFAEKPEGLRFGGVFRCTLTALTPLLVAGPQTKPAEGPTERRFFKVGGRPTIPGTSLKGMIRSAIEVLARAPMAGSVSERKVAYRDVNSADQGTPYGRRFRSGDEVLCAGMLTERGAERHITPYSWMRLDGNELGVRDCDQRSARDKYQALRNPMSPLGEIQFSDTGSFTQSGDPIAKYEQSGGRHAGFAVFTGGLWGKKYLDYVFHNPQPNARLEVPDEVWRDFNDQLSAAQEDLLKYLRKLRNPRGLPCFFLKRRVASGFEVTAIGLSRYFRIVAPHQPGELASCLSPGDGIGLPERMFGRVGGNGGFSLAGRVKFHAASLQGTVDTSAFPKDGNLVAGNPSPTAVSHYLLQDAASVLLREGRQPQNEGLTTFASDQPILRGRKLYWHRHTPYAPPPPNTNQNVQARYHPLNAGAQFAFDVCFESLDETELGALMEGLALPEGAAHKLGLGKPFGLGSVRVEIDWKHSQVQADRDRYRSLRSRCTPIASSDAIIANSKAAFRKAVTQGKGDFESLAHVREFRAMTSFESPRDPNAIRYMELRGANGAPSYQMKPILRPPLDVRGAH